MIFFISGVLLLALIALLLAITSHLRPSGTDRAHRSTVIFGTHFGRPAALPTSAVAGTCRIQPFEG